MQLDVMEAAFDRLFASGFVRDYVSIVWHAGEPLTVGIAYFSGALEILASGAKKYGYDKSYINGIQTNAILINDDWCALLKAHNFRVGVSIDGPQFLHDRMRTTRSKKGTFEATLRGIKALQKHGLNINAINVLCDFSLDYAREIHDFYADHNIRVVGFNLDEVEGANRFSSFTASPRSRERFQNFLIELYDLVEASGAFEVREFELAKGVILGTQTQRDTESQPYSIISVDYRGNFSTYSPELLSMSSDIYDDFVLGNVVSTSFLEATNTRKFKAVYEDVTEGLKQCKTECQYYALCGGGSPSNKYFEHGSFRRSETLYCQLMKKVVLDVVLEKMEQAL